MKKKILVLMAEDKDIREKVAKFTHKYITLLDLGKSIVMNTLHTIDEVTVDKKDVIIVKDCGELDKEIDDEIVKTADIYVCCLDTPIDNISKEFKDRKISITSIDTIDKKDSLIAIAIIDFIEID